MPLTDWTPPKYDGMDIVRLERLERGKDSEVPPEQRFHIVMHLAAEFRPGAPEGGVAWLYSPDGEVWRQRYLSSGPHNANAERRLLREIREEISGKVE